MYPDENTSKTFDSKVILDTIFYAILRKITRIDTLLLLS